MRHLIAAVALVGVVLQDLGRQHQPTVCPFVSKAPTRRALSLATAWRLMVRAAKNTPRIRQTGYCSLYTRRTTTAGPETP